MKQICLICERTAAQHTLYCQDARCPAERSPSLLDSGDHLDDLEIIAPVATLRTSILYVASRGEQRVLLKVAHPDPRAAARLKRESDLLRDLAGKAGKTIPVLPTLLPPYPHADLSKRSYGSTMIGGQLLYFSLFAFFEGEPLRAALARNAQPWVNHAGWIAHGLANAVGWMHSRGVLHLAISPDAALIHFDQATGVPKLLLCDLGIAASATELIDDRPAWRSQWYREAVPPGYTAPELIDIERTHSAVGYPSDVYGVGLLLYEMLIGRPAFPTARIEDQITYELVSTGKFPSNPRVLDAKELAAVANRAISNQRYEHLQAFDKELLAATGPVPEARPPLWGGLERPLLALVVLLALAFFVTVVLDVLNITLFS
jgi:serine/threonine protein kinase